MSATTATHTAQEVAEYVKRQFGDESGVQVTDADIVRWINAAQRDIFAQKEPVKSITSADLIAGQTQYSWPPNILQVQSVRINGKRVKGMSFQEAEEYLVTNDPDNTTAGQPMLWYQYGSQFFIWPSPSSGGTGGIQIYYIPAPVMISAVTDLLSVPDTMFNPLLDHVLSQAYEMDENFEGSQLKAQSFAGYMSSNENEGEVEFDVYPRITVLTEDM